MGQKGFIVMVSLFLFMLLSIFALNLAQMIAVDSSIIPSATGTTTGMGPQKEFEREQAYYLAQAGLNQLRKMLKDNHGLTNLDSICGSPGCTITNNDDATSPNGYYRLTLTPAPSIANTDTTLASDVIAKSYAAIPATGAVRTDAELWENYWRSPRVDIQGTLYMSDHNYRPVNLIDTTDGIADGFEANLGTRNAPQNNPIQIGGTCIPVMQNIRFDFGTQLSIKEMLFLNTSPDYVSKIDVWTWNDSLGKWDLQGSPIFPKPSSDTIFSSNPADSCYNLYSTVYNGDRCSNFLKTNNKAVWDSIAGGNDNVCNASSACSTLSNNFSDLNQEHSYIAQFILPATVTTSRVQLAVYADISGTGTGRINLREVGFYDGAFGGPGDNLLESTLNQIRVSDTANSAIVKNYGALSKNPTSNE